MTGNFYDSSALGKHYHQEVGTPKVDQLLADQGTRHLISRLTVVEIHSVFAKKVRTGAINQADFQLLSRRFRGDVRRRKLQVVRLASPYFQAAELLVRRLAPTQNLRTLDALQLAVALELHVQGLVHQFVCADRNLCMIAAGEGLSVTNPEVP
jgi:predicted nucleic acid-binding protein